MQTGTWWPDDPGRQRNSQWSNSSNSVFLKPTVSSNKNNMSLWVSVPNLLLHWRRRTDAARTKWDTRWRHNSKHNALTLLVKRCAPAQLLLWPRRTIWCKIIHNTTKYSVTYWGCTKKMEKYFISTEIDRLDLSVAADNGKKAVNFKEKLAVIFVLVNISKLHVKTASRKCLIVKIEQQEYFYFSVWLSQDSYTVFLFVTCGTWADIVYCWKSHRVVFVKDLCGSFPTGVQVQRELDLFVKSTGLSSQLQVE